MFVLNTCLQDEPEKDAALEARAAKNATPKVPKKVKQQIIFEVDEDHPEGFKETTVLMDDEPEQNPGT